ncbi:MAG: signal peptidase I [Candidatus Limnocylindria bacterium]
MKTQRSQATLKAGSVVLRTALVAAIVLTLFVAYGLINNAWYHVLAVRGGSMEPTITAGDLVVITRPPAEIEVGQVLTLQIDAAIVTHRVVEVLADGSFVTQGDANDARDDWSGNDVHIVGEYRFSLPFIGALVEPIISGAWVNDDALASTTIGSGSWTDEAVARTLDPENNRITWEPIASAEPTPSESAAPSEEPSPTEAPSEEASPTEEAATEDASPSEEASPSGEASPSEDASPSEEPTPSEETSPTESASPTLEEPPSDDPTPSEEASPAP